MEIENVYVVIDNEDDRIKAIEILSTANINKIKDWWSYDLTFEKQKEYWENKIKLVDDNRYLVYVESHFSWFFINEKDLFSVRYINEIKQPTRTEITIQELKTILNR